MTPLEDLISLSHNAFVQTGYMTHANTLDYTCNCIYASNDIANYVRTHTTQSS